MKFVIENCMFMNGGDAAIQVATRQILASEFPDAEIVFCDSGWPAITSYYPEYDIQPMTSVAVIKAFPMRALRKVFRHRDLYKVQSLYLQIETLIATNLKRLNLPMLTLVEKALEPYLDADVVVTAGGTYLVSKYDFSRRILEFQKDAQLNLPIIFFTQSFEPFKDNRASRLLAPHLTNSPLILTRHEMSSECARQLAGSAINTQVLPDSVFALWEPGATDMLTRRTNAERAPSGPLRIAISVRNILDYGDRSKQEGRDLFNRSIVILVERLVAEQGAEVTFVSSCQGIPEYWTDDSEVAKEILALLPDHVKANVQVNDDFHTPEQLIALFKTFDGVIANRLHVAIMSVCANTPVFAISYETKFEETFADMGLPELVLKAGELVPDTLSNRVFQWLGDLDNFNGRQAEGAMRMSKEASAAGRLISEAISVR